MNRLSGWLLVAFVIVGAVGYAFYQQYREQALLNAQLRQLDLLLMADNMEAEKKANNVIEAIAAAVVKNRSQPRELVVLAAARKLDGQADSLVHALRTQAEELLRATGNLTASEPLPHPQENQVVVSVLRASTTARQGWQQQLHAYVATLQRLHPAATVRLSSPVFDGLPVVAALATFSQLESQVWVAETEALQQLAKKIEKTRLDRHIAAVATAESNTVAPGETYKAKLFLVSSLSVPSLTMTCNGQPVSIGPDGMGRVRFTASKRPGPSTWLGTIRFRSYGHDSTFQVRVPYRIVAR